MRMLPIIDVRIAAPGAILGVTDGDDAVAG